MSGDISLGKLKVEADTESLDKFKEKMAELKEGVPTVGQLVDKLVKSFMDIPGPIGVAAVGFTAFAAGLSEMINKTVESQIRLLELSETMGVPIEQLQPFIIAMDMAGVSGEKLEKSMGKLATSVSHALTDPTGKAADAFAKLGISQEELAKGDTEQILKDAAKGFDQYADSASKTAAIRELLGKQGPSIIAEMKEEADNEERARQVMEDYGTTVTETDAKSAKYFESTLKLGESMFSGVANSITKSLLPGLQNLAEEFVESGKQGGFMRDVLDGAAAAATLLSRVIISVLVETVRTAVADFKVLGTIAGGVFAAINQAVHGEFKAAGETMKQSFADSKQILNDASTASEKFEAALWGTAEATEATATKAEEGGEKWANYDKNAKTVGSTLGELNAKMAAQLTIMDAASKSLDDYKAAQMNVAVATERHKLALIGATEEQKKEAETAIRGAEAAKQKTADEVAGYGLLNSLKQTQLNLLNHETELNKTLAAIKKNSGMTQAQQEEAIAIAKTTDALKLNIETTKQIAAMESIAANGMEKVRAAMVLTNNEMRVYNQLAALRKHYEADIKKEGADVDALRAAYHRLSEEIKNGNAEIVKSEQSGKAFTDSFSKGLQQSLDDVKNMNTFGLKAASTLTDGLTTAFMELGTKGSSAFQAVADSMIKMFEQQLIRFAIIQAEIAILAAFGVSPETAAILIGGATKSANGNVFSSGSVTPFADGGIVNGPTLTPMSLMGENGPEGVFPLARGANGQLGVQAVGGAGSQGGTAYYDHRVNINVHSNQNPHDIARETKKQLNMAVSISRKSIADERRDQGLLTSPSQAF